MAAYRMRLSDNQVRVVLRVDAFEATQVEEEMHFGFSSAEVEGHLCTCHIMSPKAMP